MNYWIKKLSLGTMAFALACIQMVTASATEIQEPNTAPHVTEDHVNEIKIIEGQDWENPETGEYFRWLDEVPSTRGTVAKYFEFRITTSVTSSSFKIDSTAVNIYASATVRSDEDDRLMTGYDDTKFTVMLRRGLWSKTIKGTVGDGLSGSITGLTSGTDHYIRINCSDRLPDGSSLVGDGRVELA